MHFLMEFGKIIKMCKDISADALEILSRLQSTKKEKEDPKIDSRPMDICNITICISAPTLLTMNEERGSFSEGPRAVFSKLFTRGTLLVSKNNHGSPQPCSHK